jgi:TRAP-type C4-dicarboxylate transport system permease small subunit
MLKHLDQINNYICRIGLWISVSGFSAILIMNSANLLSRWFLGYTFDWILEASLILFVYSVMFIVPVLYKDKGFIQMHLIEDLIGPKATKYLSLFVDVLILIFIMYLFPHALSLSLSQTELLSRGLGIPRIYVTLPVAIAAFLALLVCVSNIIHQIQDLHFGKKERTNSQD